MQIAKLTRRIRRPPSRITEKGNTMRLVPSPVRNAASTFALALAATALTLGLTACGGGDDDPVPATAAAATNVTITGVAATGAPIKGGKVNAVNAAGKTATATTAADGSYSISVAAGAPYALNITDAAGKVWYSFAPDAGVANITPLSTLALSKANANKPLSALYDAWGTAPLSSDAVLNAAKLLNANFQTQFAAKNVDYTKFNVFDSAFAANGAGYDAVLDSVRVQFNCTATSCTETVTSPAGSTLVTWNGNLATGGISLSFTAGGSTTNLNVNIGSCKAAAAGTYSMLVDTTVTGIALAIPQICVDGLPAAPTSQSDFCNGADYAAQLPAGVQVISCAYANNVGTYNVRISSPLVLDYTVKYTFVKR
jgi:hypothetical protein